MTGTPRLWLATFVALVFLIGLSAGVLVDRTLLAPPGRADVGGGRGGGPIGLYGPLGPPPDRYVSDLARRLDLSDEQQERILAVLEERQPQIQELQAEARDQFVAEQQALFAAIAAELTPEQAEVFEELTSRQRGGPGRGGGQRGGRNGSRGAGRGARGGG